MMEGRQRLLFNILSAVPYMLQTFITLLQT